MGDTYRVIGAANLADLGVLDGPEFFEITKDMDEADPRGQFTLHARAGSDGIGFTGTLPELFELLEEAQRAVVKAMHATATPETGLICTVATRYQDRITDLVREIETDALIG